MRNYIPHIIIAVLIVAIVFQCTDQVSLKESVASEKQKVKGLEKEIVGLDADIEKLNSEKDKLNILIGTLNQKIESGKNEILNIRKNRDEKISVINNLSSGQLQQFFSERYPE